MYQGACEWCLSHLLNLALVDACGVSQHLKNSKNLEARKATMAVRRVLEQANMNDKASMRMEEAQLETDGQSHRLPNFSQKRWSGT